MKINILSDPSIPNDTIKFVSNGKVVGVINNLSEVEMVSNGPGYYPDDGESLAPSYFKMSLFFAVIDGFLIKFRGFGDIFSVILFMAFSVSFILGAFVKYYEWRLNNEIPKKTD